MKYNPEKHKRRSIRVKNYDYSCPGFYYITVCVQHRECLLGHIEDAAIILNKCGRMVEFWWEKIFKKFNYLSRDEYIIMPNHIHGIIEIVGADLCVCPEKNQNKLEKGEHTGSPLHHLIQWFKTMSTNEYIRNVYNHNWVPFDNKFWQRNYYERIIINEKELNKTRQYIKRNPLKWDEDENNPLNIK